AVGFSTLLTVWLRKQSASLLKLNLAYTLVIGGALGNLVDRLMHGFVVDFIDFFWAKSHYPAFNIADSAICIGAVLIIWDAFLSGKSETDSAEGVKK
ncbi:signal peptidase II, partial [Shewanella sp.]